MAHRYGELVRVEITKTAPGGGILHAFTWRGERYPVVEVLGRWHLAARRWEPEKHSDRWYHRVETPGQVIFELYLDCVPGAGMLKAVHD